jgi:hypothetical protein
MDGSLSESVQQLMRPGMATDLYYPDSETSGKQAFRTSQTTRFSQTFQGLSGGTSVFQIPPANGIQDVVCTFALPAVALPNIAVGRGWGYALIKEITYRYGGSTQYKLTGQQVLQAALAMAADGSSRDALLSLGGNAASGSDFATQKFAYVWLPLPHCSPSVVSKPPPFPSDLLTSSIQVQVELYPISSIFSVGSGASDLSLVPTGLSVASFTVQQVIMDNQGDCLARRIDMTQNALSYPIKWRQQEVTVELGALNPTSAGVQTVTLTGFSSGEVKEIHAWITCSADTPTLAVGAVQNPFNWYALENIEMSYSGLVYAKGDANSMQLWNLVNGRIPALANSVAVVAGATPTVTTVAAPAWSVLQFGQAYDPITAHSMYVAGVPVLNGIVNLKFTIPKLSPTGGTPPSGTGITYTLHTTYVYNGVLSLSQGSCGLVL